MKPIVNGLSVALMGVFLCGADAGKPGEFVPSTDLPNPFQTVARISKFTRDGKFIHSFGNYGKVWYRIPDPLELVGTSAAESIAVDARGNVYGGEVGPRQLVRHVKQ